MLARFPLICLLNSRNRLCFCGLCLSLFRLCNLRKGEDAHLNLLRHFAFLHAGLLIHNNNPLGPFNLLVVHVFQIKLDPEEEIEAGVNEARQLIGLAEEPVALPDLILVAFLFMHPVLDVSGEKIKKRWEGELSQPVVGADELLEVVLGDFVHAREQSGHAFEVGVGVLCCVVGCEDF